VHWTTSSTPRTGYGLRGRHKIVWQTVVALGVAVYVQNHFGFNGVRIPFVGDVEITSTIFVPLLDRNVELGAIFFIVVAVLAIVGCSNGVNLTDGLDGLAGGTLAFAFISYMMIALLNDPEQPNLALVCAIVVGAIIGFLWFNVHPAQVFMGDSGALSLGGMLAVVALLTGQVMILPFIGLIFVLETASDIIQVGSYKLRGKRVFRMAPLHHHFELGGWERGKGDDAVLDSRSAGRAARGDRSSSPRSRSRSAMGRRIVELDRLTAAGVRAGALDGRSVTVLGLARSGTAMARFFADAGAHVTVYDGRSAGELAPAIAALGSRPIELALGRQ